MTVEELKEALKDVPDYYEVEIGERDLKHLFKADGFKKLNLIDCYQKVVITSSTFFVKEETECKSCCEHTQECMHYRSV